MRINSEFKKPTLVDAVGFRSKLGSPFPNAISENNNNRGKALYNRNQSNVDNLKSYDNKDYLLLIEVIKEYFESK